MSGDHTKYHGTAEVVKREWVGLTKQELQSLCLKSYRHGYLGETYFDRGYFADAIEAKLKEKNNG